MEEELESAQLRAELERRFSNVEGLDRVTSRWGHGPAYAVGGREVAHFHGDRRLDVRLTSERIRLRRAEGELDARVRTRGPSAQWIEVHLTGPDDLPLALALVEEAVRANQL